MIILLEGQRESGGESDISPGRINRKEELSLSHIVDAEIGTTFVLGFVAIEVVNVKFLQMRTQHLFQLDVRGRFGNSMNEDVHFAGESVRVEETAIRLWEKAVDS